MKENCQCQLKHNPMPHDIEIFANIGQFLTFLVRMSLQWLCHPETKYTKELLQYISPLLLKPKNTGPKLFPWSFTKQGSKCVWPFSAWSGLNPANKYMLKVNSRNTRKKCKNVKT